MSANQDDTMSANQDLRQDLRIGIDVGGTNTDAVVINTAGEVLNAVKVATTPEPIDGIRESLQKVLQPGGSNSSPNGSNSSPNGSSPIDNQIDRAQVTKAMLGTTHLANAIIQRKGLDKVAVLRLAAPSSLGVRSGAAWPADIRDLVIGAAAIVEGGNEYNGAEIAALDEAAVRQLGQAAADAGCKAIAVSAAFSPASTEHELRALEILQEEVGDEIAVSLSHQVGSLGLLERENATILNASLISVAAGVVKGFEAALDDQDLNIDAYLTQNDGTLMTAAEAGKFPVLTLGSGPTNSMRGACALADVNDAVVIDVGGTSADAGILVDGFPRESTAAVEVGGVRTNFRMPDLISIGLGGGTIVRDPRAGASAASATSAAGATSASAADALAIGPDSVGYAVVTEALCVGGSTLTLSDVSLAGGRLEGFGDPKQVAEIDRSLVADALSWVDEQVTIMSERMKSSRSALPLLAVGGGAHLIPDEISGVSEVMRPANHSVANAYGACIAEASGAVDRVYSYDDAGREACLEDARELASNAAVRAGADSDQVRITTVTEVPMTYVPGGGCRVMVKAAGPLA